MVWSHRSCSFTRATPWELMYHVSALWCWVSYGSIDLAPTIVCFSMVPRSSGGCCRPVSLFVFWDICLDRSRNSLVATPGQPRIILGAILYPSGFLYNVQLMFGCSFGRVCGQTLGSQYVLIVAIVGFLYITLLQANAYAG